MRYPTMAIRPASGKKPATSRFGGGFRQDPGITDAITASGNLSLWGDPAGNRLLALLAGKILQAGFCGKNRER